MCSPPLKGSKEHDLHHSIKKRISGTCPLASSKEWERQDPGVARVRWGHFISKNEVGLVTIMDSGVKAVIRTVWLTETQGTGQLIVVSLGENWVGNLLDSDVICVSGVCWVWKTEAWVESPERSQSLNQLPGLSQFIDREHWEWRAARGGATPPCQDSYHRSSSKPSLRRNLWPFKRVITHCGRRNGLFGGYPHWLWTDTNSWKPKIML